MFVFWLQKYNYFWKREYHLCGIYKEKKLAMPNVWYAECHEEAIVRVRKRQ